MQLPTAQLIFKTIGTLPTSTTTSHLQGLPDMGSTFSFTETRVAAIARVAELKLNIN